MNWKAALKATAMVVGFIWMGMGVLMTLTLIVNFVPTHIIATCVAGFIIAVVWWAVYDEFKSENNLPPNDSV